MTHALRNSARAKGLTAALGALALAACATATPYQPLGTGSVAGGYASTQLDQNTFRVRFVGNSMTDRERVENYLLFRAAQLTMEQGYTCFTLAQRDVERHVDQRVSRRFHPGVGFYRGWSPYWDFYGPFGRYYYDPWLDRPFFPSSYDIDTIERYTATAEIDLSRGACAGPQTFQASQVIANLQPLVELPEA